MKKIEDETLMAYVDGELDPAEQAEIEALIGKDQDLRARAEIFRQGAELARLALADTIREPIPDTMLDSLHASARPGFIARLFGSGTSKRPRWIIPVRGFEVAAAACLLLIVGGVAGSQFGGDTVYNDAMDPRIAEALTTGNSGAVVLLAGSDGAEDVLPLLTFVDGEGRYCRHYLYHDARSDTGRTLDGVACIDSGGDWLPIVTVQIEGAEANDGGYVTASGGESVLIDDFIASAIEGAPIAGTNEGALIDSGWTRN